MAGKDAGTVKILLLSDARCTANGGGCASRSDESHSDRCQEGQGRAEQKCRRRSRAIPDRTENERCGQRTQSDREIVPPERRSTLEPRHKIGDQRFLRSLCHRVKQSVHREQRPRVPLDASQRKSQIYECIKSPSGDDERLASVSI